jgi:replicative DNA helicase
MAGVPTGFVDLDDLTNGLHAGQMIIIAARPGMGKSTLGLDLARAASIKHKLTSCFFSLEMGKSEIVQRLISAEAGVPLNHIRKGQMGDDDWQRIARKTGEVSSAPLFIDDSPNLTMMEIRAKARRLKQRHDLKLVIVDYMQLMTSGKKVESRQLEVSEFSRQMKLLAKELDVPVVALSQLNRGPEQRTDKKPMLSDLRESGSLEQDADMVILLHRADAYDKDSDRVGEADFIVAKHRNGPTATISTVFQGHYSRFVDMQR